MNTTSEVIGPTIKSIFLELHSVEIHTIHVKPNLQLWTKCTHKLFSRTKPTPLHYQIT